MKKLEELGISPAPWKCATNDCGEFIGILNRRGFYVARFAYDIKPQDASLKAAAPDMYEALFDALPWLADIGAEIVGTAVAAKIAAVVKKGEAALAKAAGEVLK